mmetsp:Transcript_1996/g.3649  ORF Transcript_1996/g.3649 Transcript_1996/m.3649 type:complete len:316 (+) Transcript_1996:1145-2092(+)
MKMMIIIESVSKILVHVRKRRTRREHIAACAFIGVSFVKSILAPTIHKSPPRPIEQKLCFCALLSLPSRFEPNFNTLLQIIKEGFYLVIRRQVNRSGSRSGLRNCRFIGISVVGCILPTTQMFQFMCDFNDTTNLGHDFRWKICISSTTQDIFTQLKLDVIFQCFCNIWYDISQRRTIGKERLRSAMLNWHLPCRPMNQASASMESVKTHGAIFLRKRLEMMRQCKHDQCVIINIILGGLSHTTQFGRCLVSRSRLVSLGRCEIPINYDICHALVSFIIFLRKIHPNQRILWIEVLSFPQQLQVLLHITTNSVVS